MAEYGMSATIPASFDEVKPRLLAALKDQGFGILTTIDMQATMREKLGVEMERYEILGACNPPLAHRAVEADRDIGLLLPCNVVIRDAGESGTTVSLLDPEAMFSLAQGPDMAAVADLPGEARRRLRAALDALQGAGAG